jgi:type I restriction enzyme S subunit
MSECDKTVWPLQKLGDLFSINGEQIFPARFGGDEFIHHSIPAWDENGKPTIDIGTSIESNKILISRPSVLVSKLNPRKPRVSTVSSFDHRKQCCSTEFICYQPKDRNECLDYWGLYFASNDFRIRLEKVAIGSTNSHTRANPKETLGWLVPNPSIHEKVLISKIFEEINATIHQTEAIIEKLKQIKQGFLHDLLTRGIGANGELRPPPEIAPQLYKESALGWIPREWALSELDLVTDWFSGGTPNRARRAWWNGNIPFLTPKDMKTFYIEDTIEHITENAAALGSKLMPAETVFIVVRGMILAHSFPVCLSSRPLAFNQDIKAIRGRGELSSRFLAHWFVANASLFLRKVTEATHGTKKLDSQILYTALIGIPSSKEQTQIIERIEALDHDFSAELEKFEKLKSLKSALMYDLLTGRVRVTPLLTETAATPS